MTYNKCAYNAEYTNVYVFDNKINHVINAIFLSWYPEEQHRETAKNTIREMPHGMYNTYFLYILIIDSCEYNCIN